MDKEGKRRSSQVQGLAEGQAWAVRLPGMTADHLAVEGEGRPGSEKLVRN